ncbi:sodium:proton antiporter [Bacteroidia bacterium]|nr:sodium:proton antiporter [Bacteroidia bacterium]
MNHLPALISDLALILITAGVVTILFKWLKQPVVLGYIVAGFLVGPHISLLPSVLDNTSVEVWSEIGIIFLLFALGLEFRFHKLLTVGGSALTAAIINMGAMIGIGYWAGNLLGWTSMESIFLGGMLSMASTTIIIKAFTDMGKQNQHFASIVFAILIIEDIAAILMMVMFSTIAVSKNVESGQLIESLFRLVFFIVIWFTVGIFLIPTIIKKLKKYLNNETLLVVSIGLCLGMVMLASSVGFSSALGAFIMGSILAESVESKRIEHLVEPLKNLFGAIFFVSVGMMIIPEYIVSQWSTILILTAVVIVGRIIFATVGTVVAGESLKVAVQTGFSLAQIGEFSFIIATLGMQLGVFSDFIYPVIVGVSVITTFTTPYAIRYSEKVYDHIDHLLPKRWRKLRVGYAAARKKHAHKEDGSFKFHILLNKLLMPVLIYFILSVAVNILCKMFLIPLTTEYLQGTWGAVLSAVFTLSLMAPFLMGMLRRGTSYFRLLMRNMLAPSRKKQWTNLLLSQIPKIVCIVLIVSVLAPLFPLATTILLVVIAIVIVIVISLNPRVAHQSNKMESVFLDNLSDNDEEEKKEV